MSTLPSFLARRRTWIIAAILAGLVGLYALLGFKVLPGVIRDQAVAFVAKTYQRDLHIGEVRFNPFTFQLEVRDLEFPDTDRKAMLGLERLFVDFEVASLWRRAWVFKDVDLEVPAVRAVLRRDGSMNLAALAPPAASPAPAQPADAAEKSLPSLWIESLRVTQGRLDYIDAAGRTRPLVASFVPVNFSLQDFRTTPEGGVFSLTARNDTGAQLDWKGRFALAPNVASQGDFSITSLSASRVAEFAGDALPAEVSAGTLGLRGHYDFRLGTRTELELQLPEIALQGLGLRARGESTDWVRVPTLRILDAALQLPEQSVAIRRIALEGLEAKVWLNPDGSVNLQQFARQPATASPEATGMESPPAPSNSASPRPAATWALKLAEFALSGATVELEDRMKAPVKKFTIAPLALTAHDLSLDLSKPVQLSAEATINDQALVKSSGQVTPAPLAASLDLALEKARLAILQPYILPVADLTVKSGTVDVKGHLELAPPEATGPRLTFAGEAVIDGFRTTDNVLREDLVNFHRLQVQKLRYEQAPDSLVIDRIVVLRPYARVIIGQEQILNISAVLDPKGTAAELAARRQLAAVRASETKAEQKQREKLEKARAAQAEKERRKAGKPAAPAPLPATTSMPIRIREVRIDGGRMNFSDFTVQPNFSAEIRNLKGAVSGLSSAPTSRAKVDLTGDLGEFAPVVIAGTIQPFAYDRFTDIGMSFENISLPVFNPYSGRFAGYNIAKGKLTTKLHYLIENRKLKADHNIRIDQLEWGAATDTKGEATLPVKFATALLRDRHGVINLDVPITGTLDDPKLRIGPIVWQIIKNIIVKAVTAPFALLGSLFKGAEEAQFVDFAPGDATLDAATGARLATLAKGLVEKDGINLDVPIGMVAELDRPGLVEQRYRQQLAELIVAKYRPREGDTTPLPAFESLAPKQQLELVTALLRKQGGVPKPPPAPAVAEGTPRADAKLAEEAATLAFLQQEARARITVNDADLEALAQERANAVQRALVGADSGLEASRVFITRQGKVGAQDGKVRLELGLK